jgi:hypothetical protein
MLTTAVAKVSVATKIIVHRAFANGLPQAVNAGRNSIAEKSRVCVQIQTSNNYNNNPFTMWIDHNHGVYDR